MIVRDYYSEHGIGIEVDGKNSLLLIDDTVAFYFDFTLAGRLKLSHWTLIPNARASLWYRFRALWIAAKFIFARSPGPRR
jgi:hypothetical protein